MGKKKNSTDIAWDKNTVLEDYRLAVLSRNLSVIGSREVLTQSKIWHFRRREGDTPDSSRKTVQKR